jgi:hypothetical protein
MPWKIKEYIDKSSGNDVIVYRSKLLAKVLDKSYFMESTPGTFIAELEPKIDNPSKYFGVVIGPGNTP